jgi:two-component sensor histidine kinase
LPDSLKEQNLTLHKLLEQAGLDSAQRDIAERIQAVLTAELHHRMKNMLAMVTAIVRQSIRTATSLEAAERAIGARLIAMAKAHEVLLKADLATAGLTGIVRGATEQHNAALGRIVIEGEEIEIVAASVLPLTLMLNELCTNATKYGALSADTGHVSLSWNLDGAGKQITFRWIEAGGPVVAPPGPRSFGTRLIEEALPRQLGGTGHLSFPATGVEFTLTVPLESLMGRPAAKVSA